MKRYFSLLFLIILFATASLARAIENTPDSLFNAALDAEDHGNLLEAIKLHKSIVALQPNNSKSLIAIAGLYGVLGNFQAEIQWANKAIKVDPNNPKAFVNLGNAYVYLGDYSKAKAAYDTATTVSPKSGLSYYSLGVLSEMTKDPKKAEFYYIKATQVESGFENAYFNLGALYANQGKFNEAISALNIVLKINPSANDARQMLKQIEEEIAKR